ncbi:MAG: hypothetical protein E5W02_19395 [Mesorhizobium sp.]|nr:MAG: hypothetical protein E5W02_19395 [Mesorhizobium sp.]
MDGKFTSRALFPFDGERKVEFYELRFAPGHTENAEAHAPGTIENLILIKGRLEIRVGHTAPMCLQRATRSCSKPMSRQLPESHRQ